MHSVQQVEACTLADTVKTALTDSTFSFTSCGINTFLALVLPVRAFEADTYTRMVAVASLDMDCDVGRYFYMCSRPPAADDEGQCKTFKWATAPYQ